MYCSHASQTPVRERKNPPTNACHLRKKLATLIVIAQLQSLLPSREPHTAAPTTLQSFHRTFQCYSTSSLSSSSGTPQSILGTSLSLGGPYKAMPPRDPPVLQTQPTSHHSLHAPLILRTQLGTHNCFPNLEHFGKIYLEDLDNASHHPEMNGPSSFEEASQNLPVGGEVIHLKSALKRRLRIPRPENPMPQDHN